MNPDPATALSDVLDQVNQARQPPVDGQAEPGGALESLLAALDLLLRLDGEQPGERVPRHESSEGLAQLRELLGDAEGAAGGNRNPALMADLAGFLVPLLEGIIDAMLDHPSHRLAVYGSLAPGEANHHLVADLEGEWWEGVTRGERSETGWGNDLGYPALLPDTEGPSVNVQVLESDDLPGRWNAIDRFEGTGYRRVLVRVEREGVARVCNLYAARQSSSAAR